MKSSIFLCLAILTTIPAAVLAAAAPGGGPAPTREVVWTRHQLYAANELNHYRQFEETSHMKVLNQGNMIIGSGQKGDKHSHAMELKAGVDHLVMVACDEDCFDVNLRVYDADGKLVGEDTRMPKIDTRMVIAEVQLIPAATQTYRLEVEAYCREGSIGACSYAVGVNTK
jgi:hypothetical protein